jgi:hypothetical protein
VKLLVLAALIVATSLVPSDCFAQVPELLIEVTGSEEATVRAENEYFLKKHLYFAKRHRIVRINDAALESQEAIRISTFDRESLIVAVTKREVDRNGFTTGWEGEIAEPPFSAKELMDQVPTLEEAKLLHSSMFTVVISTARYAYDELTGAITPTRADEDPENASPRSSSFYGLHANISIPTLSGQYRLRSLEMDPRYHILIEDDQAKLFPPGPLYDDEHPELGVRRRQYAEFLRSLGEDPRRSTILRERSQ